MFDFQKLEVYKKSKLFHSSCKKLIRKNNFDNFVKDQLGRASFGVPLNIVEGSGKFSKADRKNYFTTARASLFECVALNKSEKQSESDVPNSYFFFALAPQLLILILFLLKPYEQRKKRFDISSLIVFK